jgi:SAM-dependent methyltransferase
MKPMDLATDQTFAFVRRFLPEDRLRVLEVGCGRGELAGKLRESGYEITGVELSPECVQSARAAGLDVRQADFLGFEEEPFDAVLFTRSLHHLSPLSDAIARARILLKPGGLLIAEEFDVEHVDRPTAVWFYRAQALLVAAEALHYDPPTGPADPLARWEQDHLEHAPLHPGEALISAVKNRFDLLVVERPGYLFRYFCGKLQNDAAGGRLAEEIFQAEDHLIRDHRLMSVGLRLVAKRSVL